MAAPTAPEVEIGAPSAAEPVVETKADKKGVIVTDALGRKLKVKKLNALDRYNLAKIVGGEGITNGGVMGPAASVFSVIEIDGVPVPPPASEPELQALILRLDDEGIDAVSKAYAEGGWLSETLDKAAAKN